MHTRNGVQAPHVEAEVDTGFVKLLNYRTVEDGVSAWSRTRSAAQSCGDIDGVSFEECLYGDSALPRSGSGHECGQATNHCKAN